jgi:ferric-dicitrate binding protein FerR (iron transport regulator)
MLRRPTFWRNSNTLLCAAALVVWASPLDAQCKLPPGSTGAVALVQSGDVTVLGDRAGYRTIVSMCSIVNQQQRIQTGADGYAKFQVADGSTFEIFPNSEVTFHKTFGIGDLLNVWMGKVKVYIQHLEGIPNPNNVTTPTALISVRGTIFDVDVQDEQGTTFVTLDEGVVDVQHLRIASRVVRLAPGQSIQVQPNLPLAMLPKDKGMVLRQVMRGIEDLAREIAYRRAGSTGGVGGGTSTPGAQGDKGKNTGNGDGTGSGSGGGPTAPTTPPTTGGGD